MDQGRAPGGQAVGSLGIAVGPVTAAVVLALALQGPAEPGWAAATAVLLGACAGGLVVGLEALIECTGHRRKMREGSPPRDAKGYQG